MNYILQTKDLTKKYGNFIALNKLNMNVPEGSIYGFVGKNGAGKTTLIRLLTGLQNKTSGSFTIKGVKDTDSKINDTRKKMGAIVETPSIFLDKTAKENLLIQYQILGIKDTSKVDEILELVGLSNTGKKHAKDFSLGMRQRLAIAISLCGNPDFLVLDEPINGLDPEGIKDVRRVIKKLNEEQKITIIISSHILDELSRVATYYGFISDGKIIAEMSSNEFMEKRNKYINIETDKELESVLINNNYKYKLISKYEAKLYGHVEITDLVKQLDSEGIRVEKLTEVDENLEDYFFSLLGGKKND